MSTFVTFMYWSAYAAFGLLALVFLIGTVFRNMRFTVARQSIDDGSEDPASTTWQIYRLSRASDFLVHAACVAILPLAASIVLAVAASGPLASIATLALAAVSMVASDVVRGRHDKLESAFLRLSGQTVSEAYADVIDVRIPAPLRSNSDSSAPSS